MTHFISLLTDIYHGRGNGGESIYGPVFEGKYAMPLFSLVYIIYLTVKIDKQLFIQAEYTHFYFNYYLFRLGLY